MQLAKFAKIKRTRKISVLQQSIKHCRRVAVVLVVLQTFSTSIGLQSCYS